jgi:hypothetical protein
MELLFQKRINLRSFLGLNNEKSKSATSVRKKKKYHRNGYKISNNSSSASYSNYSIASKKKTLFLMFIVYVIFGIVFYNLLK